MIWLCHALVFFTGHNSVLGSISLMRFRRWTLSIVFSGNASATIKLNVINGLLSLSFRGQESRIRRPSSFLRFGLDTFLVFIVFYRMFLKCRSKTVYDFIESWVKCFQMSVEDCLPT